MRFRGFDQHDALMDLRQRFPTCSMVPLYGLGWLFLLLFFIVLAILSLIAGVSGEWAFLNNSLFAMLSLPFTHKGTTRSTRDRDVTFYLRGLNEEVD